ncbi:hypothetical protein Tco_0684316 [Tanacetum coccineum]
MDEANLTLEEYIELEAEKARRHGQMFNWETATYGKFRYHENIDYFKEFETDFPASVSNDAVTTDHKISSEPTITLSFMTKFVSYKIISVNDLRTDSEDDNDEVNIPSNNVVVEQLDNIVDTIDTQSHEFDEDFETNHDIHREPSNMEDYLIMIEVMIQMRFHEGMLLIFIIKNLYVPFGIPFDPKRFYKDGVCTRKLRRPRITGQTDRMGKPIQNFNDKFNTAYPREARRQVNWVHVLDFEGLIEDMRQGLTDRLRMVYTGSEGQVLFTSHAWRRLFEIQGPLVCEFMLEFLSTCRISDMVLELDVVDTLCFQLGGARRSMSWRQFILALGLNTAEEMAGDGFDGYWADSLREIATKADVSGYWSRIASDGNFLEMVPSYTSIRDPLRRLCHKMIAVSISGRGQAPEKVTATDLFYLRSMDEGTTINVPYLLAQYLFRHAKGNKHTARMSGGHFVRRLAEHFGLVTEEGLWGSTMAWVAHGLERQQVAAAGAAHVDEEIPDEGVQADLAPSIAKLEEEVRRVRKSLGEQRTILDAMSRDFSRFTTWTVVCLSQLLDTSGMSYTSYGDYHIPYQRHTRWRTDKANTSAAPCTDDQPDP